MHFATPAGAEGSLMRNWMSQIVIGIIVTVVGTVIAHVVVKGMGGKGFFGGHYAGSPRAGR
jgi:xanthine/uracil permease